jgi:hypothetical protein
MDYIGYYLRIHILLFENMNYYLRIHRLLFVIWHRKKTTIWEYIGVLFGTYEYYSKYI